jgi:hypothetical protein
VQTYTQPIAILGSIVIGVALLVGTIVPVLTPLVRFGLP